MCVAKRQGFVQGGGVFACIQSESTESVAPLRGCMGVPHPLCVHQILRTQIINYAIVLSKVSPEDDPRF